VNDALVKEELLPKEQLLWLGQPDTGTNFSQADILVAPLSVLLAVMAFFWAASVLGVGALGDHTKPVSVPLGIFAVLVALLSFYLMVGRFLYKTWKKGRTYYAVTTKRVLVVTDGRRKSVRGQDLAQLSFIEKQQGAGKRGSLIFGSLPFGLAYYANSGLEIFGAGGTVAFFDLLDVEGVHQMIQKRKEKLG
jgi:hypothetical protein